MLCLPQLDVEGPAVAPNLSLSIDEWRDFPSVITTRSIDSRGDLVGGVDADDVRSLDVPLGVSLCSAGTLVCLSA